MLPVSNRSQSRNRFEWIFPWEKMSASSWQIPGKTVPRGIFGVEPTRCLAVPLDKRQPDILRTPPPRFNYDSPAAACCRRLASETSDCSLISADLAAGKSPRVFLPSRKIACALFEDDCDRAAGMAQM